MENEELKTISFCRYREKSHRISQENTYCREKNSPHHCANRGNQSDELKRRSGSENKQQQQQLKRLLLFSTSVFQYVECVVVSIFA